MNIRIGNGLDVHALVTGRKLVLAGVTIPFERGLKGHSDADALLHAICDAVLGALGEGDIGAHFPDTDPRYKDADSRILLRTIWQRAVAEGYSLGNVDATIVAQEPAFLARFAFELAQAFNVFYHKHHILSEKDPEKRAFLLLITALVREQLVTTLRIMGITAPEKM